MKLKDRHAVIKMAAGCGFLLFAGLVAGMPYGAFPIGASAMVGLLCLHMIAMDCEP